jgi:uncharacterized protein
MSPGQWNFHTYKDNADEWRWQLVAANGKIVADSGEGYSRLSEVREAAQRVRTTPAQPRLTSRLKPSGPDSRPQMMRRPCDG